MVPLIKLFASRKTLSIHPKLFLESSPPRLIPIPLLIYNQIVNNNNSNSYYKKVIVVAAKKKDNCKVTLCFRK